MLEPIPNFGVIPCSDLCCRFVAWAPEERGLSLVLGGSRKVMPMEMHRGFHMAEGEVNEGTRYVFRMQDGREFPDPASRFQPDGVHGPSAVVRTDNFKWTDVGFHAHSLTELVIYELHIGTFTPEGTFEAATSRLDTLADLGITAIEMMPVAQFPGTRNWGYDGVYPFAVQNSYGGPAGLHRFVDAAHAQGMSVILDAVYNHLGPEGNYLGQFGPFFTSRYCTPWGQAINFDGTRSGPVREFFIQNALYWLDDFHIDGLRLDAVHGIFDFSAHHFLAELKERVEDLAERTGRTLHVIAESDLNDARLVHDCSRGGYGLDAQWSDDFHHALHTLLTRESSGYYRDFGSLEDLGVAMRDGWRYSGQYSQVRKRRHGNSPAGIASERFVVFSQNHDQVGNRARGDRLSNLVDFESLKLAAGVTLLAPFIPLIFMGEEYGEEHPFQYFTSHGDSGLIEAVRRGRHEEFASFGWGGEVPDPQDEETFRRSKLNYAEKETEPHRSLWRLYQKLVAARKQFALAGNEPNVEWDEKTAILTLDYPKKDVAAIFHFGDKPARCSIPQTAARATALLDSTNGEWRRTWNSCPANQACEGDVLLRRRSFILFAPNLGTEE